MSSAPTNPGITSNDLEHSIAEMCIRVPVSAGATGLAKELVRLVPQLNFRDVLTRGGWYRLGGVVNADGAHIADDLAQWVEKELASRGDDLHALYDDYADSGIQATRLIGKTHYLVAPTGMSSDAFVQIEIEELQEVVSHVLFSGEVPGSVEELVDPPRDTISPIAQNPLGQPFYKHRKTTDVSAFLKRMASQRPEPQNVHRFFDAWQSCSAGNATQFCNHWVLAVREHLDRYKQSILHASPVAAVNGLPPKFESGFGARGLALYAALQKFDRQAGYSMSWFFHMLTTKTVPHAVASAVVEDLQAGFSYLPERDVKVVKDWLHKPYGF